jgi:predicted  nucleic acid-binding Zn-ribbon protein
MANPLDALLELHTLNKQRSKLLHAERKRQSGVHKAEKKLTLAKEAAERANSGSQQADALIRSLTEDISVMQAQLDELKEQQLNAATNKEYLAAINTAEMTRADMAAKQTRLASINNAAESQQAAATAAAEAVTAAEATLAEEQAKAEPAPEAAGALDRLRGLYKEARTKVDPELLARYDRLVKSGHRQPMLAVHPTTGSTSMGNRLPTSQLEKLRRGEVVIDQMTQSILYIDQALAAVAADDED